MEIKPEVFTNNALYPWSTSVGKGKLGLELEYIILIGAQCKVQTQKECNHTASALLKITADPASCQNLFWYIPAYWVVVSHIGLHIGVGVQPNISVW